MSPTMGELVVAPMITPASKHTTSKAIFRPSFGVDRKKVR